MDTMDLQWRADWHGEPVLVAQFESGGKRIAVKYGEYGTPPAYRFAAVLPQDGWDMILCWDSSYGKAKAKAKKIVALAQTPAKQQPAKRPSTKYPAPPTLAELAGLDTRAVFEAFNRTPPKMMSLREKLISWGVIRPAQA